MSSKVVYCGEWIRIRNLMNARWANAGGPCVLCKGMKINTVWYSIKSGEIRCTDCFDAEGKHFE